MCATVEIRRARNHHVSVHNHLVRETVFSVMPPWDHKDPFDRVIVAQALRRNLTIATRDAKILDAALTPTLHA
jgi:PIN domain nuclease of toxin-antitoxin system